MTALEPGPFADLLAGYCLEVQGGETVLVRSTSLAAPLLLELQRAILERDAWPLLRVELPGQTPAFYEHARDRHLDDYPDLALTEAKRVDALLGIQAPADVRELVRRRPRPHRPLRTRAAADPRGDDEEALVLDAVADRGARRAGGHGARGLRGLRAQCAVPRPARPGARPGAACAPSRSA